MTAANQTVVNCIHVFFICACAHEGHWNHNHDLARWCVYLLVKCSALWASGSEPTGSDVGIEWDVMCSCV